MGKCMGLMLQLKGVIKGVKNLLSVELQTGKKAISISRTQLKCVWVGKGNFYGGGARKGQATSAPRVVSSILNL